MQQFWNKSRQFWSISGNLQKIATIWCNFETISARNVLLHLLDKPEFVCFLRHIIHWMKRVDNAIFLSFIKREFVYTKPWNCLKSIINFNCIYLESQKKFLISCLSDWCEIWLRFRPFALLKNVTIYWNFSNVEISQEVSLRFFSPSQSLTMNSKWTQLRSDF